jgi:hypothetical protein
MTQPPPITRLGAQRAAIRELSKAIYHRNSESLAERAIRALGRLIDLALNSTASIAPSGWLGALALVVLVVVVVVVIVWRVGIPRRAATVGSVFPTGRSVSAAEHRALADHAASANDWHTAVIERMRAVARELEERGVVEPRAGRTATELARESAQLVPIAATELRSAAEVFNAIAYGNGAATAIDLAAIIAADDAVRSSARSKVLAP